MCSSKKEPCTSILVLEQHLQGDWGKSGGFKMPARICTVCRSKISPFEHYYRCGFNHETVCTVLIS